MSVRNSERSTRPIPGGTMRGEDMAQRMNEAARGWVEQMERMRRVERNLGQRLMTCATPAEAVAVSGEWMARRLDSLMALQHRLIEMWLDETRIGVANPASPTPACQKPDTTRESEDDRDA